MGFAPLLAGDCEVFMSGHELTPEEKLAATEKGVQVAERLVGHGGLVLLTAPENTVNELTLTQIRELMKGNYTNWDQVGGPSLPVVFISLEDTDTDIRIFLLNNFLKIPAFHAKTVRVINYQAAIRKAATTPGGLAYCRIRDIEISGAAGETKILKVKKEPDTLAVLPSRETIADGSYPLQRPFYLCTTNTAHPEVQKFVDFVASRGWGGEIK